MSADLADSPATPTIESVIGRARNCCTPSRCWRPRGGPPRRRGAPFADRTFEVSDEVESVVRGLVAVRLDADPGANELMSILEREAVLRRRLQPLLTHSTTLRHAIESALGEADSVDVDGG